MLSRCCRRKKASSCVDGASRVLSHVAAGGLRFLSRYHGELRQPLVLPLGSQVSIRVARASMGVLWSHGRGIRPQFTWKWESQGVSELRQEVWIPSSCHGDLREPLMLSLGSQESFRIVRGLSGFLSSWCRGLGPHLKLRRATQDSSPALRGISGFLCRLQWEVRRGFMLGHGTLLPSRVGKGVSGFLSS